MPARFEDLVSLIETTSDPFHLAQQMGTIREGVADLERRLQALEKAAKKG